jgi:uncharacterized protein YdeI (BOF family)
MKKIMIFAILFLAAVGSLLIIAGCSRNETYGAGIDRTAAIEKISNILSNPEGFMGKQVVLRGKIDMECGSGCWFYVDDGSGRIYVDLAPAGIAIPQRIGKTVSVTGSVGMEEDMIRVNASGVSF